MKKEITPRLINEEDLSIVDPETMMMLTLVALAVGLIALWLLAFFFFQKITVFFSFIVLALLFAKWFDEQTMKEAGVNLDQG